MIALAVLNTLIRISMLALFIMQSNVAAVQAEIEPPFVQESTDAAQAVEVVDLTDDATTHEDDTPVVQGPKHPDPAIDALLDKIESSADDLTGFTAKLRYEKVDALLGRSKIRLGQMIYEHTTASRPRRFAALLEEQLIQRGPNQFRKEERKQHFIFDGRWLAEISHEDKQFIARELVPEGQEFDALKLGNGPFPLPIGQVKADVLARFNVTTVALPEEGALSMLERLYPAGISGIRLTPLPGTPDAKDYTSIDLYLETTGFMPVGVLVTEVNGDQNNVRLSRLVRNPEFTEQMLAAMTIEQPSASGWLVDVRRIE
ncbi:MAG: hypothetical protein AAF432_11320 [Planctomycetota bacterium]